MINGNISSILRFKNDVMFLCRTLKDEDNGEYPANTGF